MIRNLAHLSPPLKWECAAVGGVTVVAQGVQSLRRPSTIEWHCSPAITKLTATELCRCARCEPPGGREFMAAKKVGSTLRRASCRVDEKINADPAVSLLRPVL